MRVLRAIRRVNFKLNHLFFFFFFFDGQGIYRHILVLSPPAHCSQIGYASVPTLLAQAPLKPRRDFFDWQMLRGSSPVRDQATTSAPGARRSLNIAGRTRRPTTTFNATYRQIRPQGRGDSTRNHIRAIEQLSACACSAVRGDKLGHLFRT